MDQFNVMLLIFVVSAMAANELEPLYTNMD